MNIKLNKIQEGFKEDRVLYTKHAREEMRAEEFGKIREKEVFEAILNGMVIEEYKDDELYPSMLIYGKTDKGRPLHVICAYSKEDDVTIVITAYHPDPTRWTGYMERRRER